MRAQNPGNKSIADTFLGTRWSAALPPRLLIGRELPEECIAACLWKAEERPRAHLSRTKWRLLSSLKKRGMEQECKKKRKKEAHNSGFLSFIPAPPLPTSLSHPLHYSVFFHPLPLRSHRLSCSLRFLVCSTFMMGRGREPEAAIQASLAL